jgi:hypothetical protein
MIWIIASVVAVALAVLFVATRKPYAVSRERFEDTLSRVLAKKIDGAEWDTFLHIPIGSDAYLDSLRKRLLALETKENSVGAEEGAIYNSTAMQHVAAVLDELRTKKAEQAAALMAGL